MVAKKGVSREGPGIVRVGVEGMDRRRQTTEGDDYKQYHCYELFPPY